MIIFTYYCSHFGSSAIMADISINFRYISGDENILNFPYNFTFHDLNKDDDSYISLFHIGDYAFINKHGLLSNYSEQTIYVINKQRDTLLPWINTIINTNHQYFFIVFITFLSIHLIIIFELDK